MITLAMLDAYLEKKLAPQLTLKFSVQIAEEFVWMIERRVIEKIKLARQIVHPGNRAAIIAEAEIYRAMAEKLKQACTEWHKKNPREV
jgi:hypothetical protein